MYDLQLSCSNLKMSAKKRTCTYKRHRYAQIIPYERGLQSLLSLSSMRPVTLLSKQIPTRGTVAQFYTTNFRLSSTTFALFPREPGRGIIRLLKF